MGKTKALDLRMYWTTLKSRGKLILRRGMRVSLSGMAGYQKCLLEVSRKQSKVSYLWSITVMNSLKRDLQAIQAMARIYT